MTQPKEDPVVDLTFNRRSQFLILLLVAEIALIVATWPLWFSGTAFPAVPLVPMFGKLPAGSNMLLSTCLLFSCLFGIGAAAGPLYLRRIVIAAEPEFAEQPLLLLQLLQRQLLTVSRTPFVAAIVLGSILALCNQHCLQAWHWLFLLLLVQFVTLIGSQQIKAHRLTIASIYVFAALSRIGPGIDSGMSPQVLTTLLNLTGLSNIANTPTAVFVGCCAMSCIEGLVGLGLLWVRTRRIAIIAAIVIHAMLLLALSPLGLNHNVGVLLWNVFLLLAVPLLFWHSVPEDPSDASSSRKLFVAECGFVILFPLASLFGFADNWPGWQLYSPRPDVVRLYVSADIANKLPAECQPFIGEPLPLQDLRPVRLDWWSLQSTGAPLYPEDRFQLAVIGKLLPADVSDGFRIIVDSASFPDYWNRKQTVFAGMSADGGFVAEPSFWP